MKYANGSLYILAFLFWIGPEQKRNGASHPVSYLANLHRAACAAPLLALCLASYCPYALNPENQRDVDVVELKETGTQPGVEVWFPGDGYDSAAIANQDRASDARDEKKTWKIQIPCARKQKEALLPSSGCCSGEVKSTFGFYRTLSGHFGSVFPPNRWAEPRNQKTPSCFQVQPILVQA
jgi:hypothetical protein